MINAHQVVEALELDGFPELVGSVGSVLPAVASLVVGILGARFLINAMLSPAERRTRRRVKACKKVTAFSVKRWRASRRRVR